MAALRFRAPPLAPASVSGPAAAPTCCALKKPASNATISRTSGSSAASGPRPSGGGRVSRCACTSVASTAWLARVGSRPSHMMLPLVWAGSEGGNSVEVANARLAEISGRR